MLNLSAPGEGMSVRRATVEDLKYVVHLAAHESLGVGFIPKPAYEAAITGEKHGRRWSLTCTDGLWICMEEDEPVGFALASFGSYARVAQIAIQEDARLLERGTALIDAVDTEGERRNIESLRAGCADDLPSNTFWAALGFRKAGERTGIHFESKRHSQRRVNIWQRNRQQLWLLEPMAAREDTS